MSVQRRPKRNTHESAKDPDAFIAGAQQQAATARPANSPKNKQQSKKTPVALRLDDQLLQEIDRAAARHGMSRTALISYACSKLLENE
jgi:predicted DNA binding CopG/RHH family protein